MMSDYERCPIDCKHQQDALAEVSRLRAEVVALREQKNTFREGYEELRAEVAELRERVRWHPAYSATPEVGWYVIDRGDEYQAVSVGRGVAMAWPWVRLPIPE